MIVHSAYPHDVRVAREARVALDSGYDVDVVALRNPGEEKRELVDGVRVFRLPLSHRRGVGVTSVLREYLGYTALASARSAALALRRRYDIVHVHNPPDFLIVAALLPRALGAHVVLDIHDLSPDMFAMRFEGRRGAGLADRALRSIERWATRLADVVITVHEPYRRELVARHVPSEKTAVVMNSLDERLLPEGKDQSDGTTFRVVYHGTITPPYGVQLIVEAAAELVEHIGSIRVELYGEGDSLPGIRARAQELGIAERVHLSGRYLPQAEVLERIRAADVGVIPNLATRLNRFALSSKLFEYVALGIPVVCADLPTIREHFSEEQVLFFEPGNAESLARALRSVADSPREAAARAQRALRRYETDYSWEASARTYGDLLDRLSESRDGRQPHARGPRLPAIAAQSPAGSLAAFATTAPFLFFDHFRVPNRTAAGAELGHGDVPERHPLRNLAQLAWVDRRTGEIGPRLRWPARPDGRAVPGMLPLAEFRLGQIPIYARLLPDELAAQWLGEGWHPTATVRSSSGAAVASLWRDADGNVLLPFDPSEVIQNFWSEAYRAVVGRRLARRAWEVARRSYYRLRPVLPRESQLVMRRLLSRLQTRATFPRWPVEPALHDFFGLLFAQVAELAPQPVPWLAPWPDEFEWALVLTHDVESTTGYKNLARLYDLELSLGYRSSWNFVPMRYTVDDNVVSTLLGEGFEVGVHGLYHDGRDFESLATLMARLPAMRRHAERWQASGFRSPATHRVWDWMPRLQFDYDSSYPDTDPFEPYAGGCCSWLPYFNDRLVELPITLPQDHTLFTILGHTDESLWLEKIHMLRRAGAMALLLTHPDYMLDEHVLGAYTRVLKRYADDASAWRALPRDVSGWWRRRADSSLELTASGWRVVGPAAGEATVKYASAPQHSSGDRRRAARASTGS
jgi:glycosyltransferase involved in cell wall biosynthesis